MDTDIKILILNGSPKGKYSITLQTTRYLQKVYPDHKFYKSHGQYDFPQKKRGVMLKMYLVGSILANEKLFAKMDKK